MSGRNKEDRFTKSGVTRARPLLDEMAPSVLEVATFALGCFWGPEARFGLTKGVWRTCVGYAGGTKTKPTYHDLGDHSECVQIQFDPEVVSYGELLSMMWAWHDATQPAYVDQYASIVLAHDDDQYAAARKSLAAIEDLFRRPLYTRIERLSRFWLAEDYHQKYHLHNDELLMNDFLGMYSSLEEFIDSPAAARVNGLVAGEGVPARLAQEIGLYGLSEAGSIRLGDIVMRR